MGKHIELLWFSAQLTLTYNKSAHSSVFRWTESTYTQTRMPTFTNFLPNRNQSREPGSLRVSRLDSCIHFNSTTTHSIFSTISEYTDDKRRRRPQETYSV